MAAGVAAATKSDLIVRDIDLYREIAQAAPALCMLTVTTADDDLAAKVEPGAPPPSRRLAAVEDLAKAGLFTGVLLMPVLPFLEDTEENILAVVDRAADAGAKFIYAAMGMTMREGQREHFLREMDRAFPGQGLGERYRKRYGTRYQCASPRARDLWDLFSERCRERGLLYEMRHIISASARGYADRQLTFFD